VGSKHKSKHSRLSAALARRRAVRDPDAMARSIRKKRKRKAADA
jgi:hypothetical protein